MECLDAHNRELLLENFLEALKLQGLDKKPLADMGFVDLSNLLGCWNSVVDAHLDSFGPVEYSDNGPRWDSWGRPINAKGEVFG